MNAANWMPGPIAIQRIAMGVAAIAAAVGLYAVTTTAVYLVYGPTPPAAPLELESAERRNRPAAAADVDLASLNLFGDPSVRAEAQPEPVVDAPETRLRITLIGVFVAEVVEHSAAIIAHEREQKLYRIGERLPGNSTLVEIHHDHVLLRRAGGHERLSFEKPELQLRGYAANGASGSRANRSEGQLGSGPAVSDSEVLEGLAGRSGSANAAPPGTLPPRPPGPVRSPRQFVNAYADRFVLAPEQTLAEVGVEAVSSGEAQGYRLSNVASSEELARVGLRPNDVVLSVNGEALGNIETDTVLIDEVRATGSARLEIQRRDRRFFVTLPIPQD